MAKISTQKINASLFNNKAETHENEFLPQKQTITAILNYSKSLEVKKTKGAVVATLVLN